MLLLWAVVLVSGFRWTAERVGKSERNRVITVKKLRLAEETARKLPGQYRVTPKAEGLGLHFGHSVV